MGQPVVIGLVGGVASGKSSVSRLLCELGAVRLDADEVGHEALNDRGVKKQIVEHFGPDVLNEEGEIERKKLGAKVFGQPAELKVLTDITHPWIGNEIARRLEKLRQRSDLPAICLDVSLLLESKKYDDIYDVLIFVDAHKEVRELRVATERGWKREEVGLREAHQMPLEDKKKRADVVIENNGNTETLATRVSEFWKKFIEGHDNS